MSSTSKRVRSLLITLVLVVVTNAAIGSALKFGTIVPVLPEAPRPDTIVPVLPEAPRPDTIVPVLPEAPRPDIAVR
ncbi:MAG TPA: hypothetical protein VGB89_08785 [Bacteroidota bacterium]